MLTIQNLVSGYGKVTIIRNVNINVRKGEIVSIIGRNGVGKSTFMKTVIGLLKSQQGAIIFNGKDMTNQKSHERARLGMGYVPQGHGVFPRLSVQENLRMGEQININDNRNNLNLVYEYFPKLKERSTQKAGTLSGGEQAMLSIARALIGNPDLLLLDEPSEGIQPNVIEQINEIVRKINRDLGLTVLFVEQNIRLIQNMSHRCYAMDKGTIIGEIEREKLSDYNVIKKYLAV